jgi:hypothetical protein
MSDAAIGHLRRELAHRVSGGIEVTLYWHPDDDGTSVEVRDWASGERLAFAVDRERALDAFHHPFAHVPSSIGRLAAAFEAGARL